MNIKKLLTRLGCSLAVLVALFTVGLLAFVVYALTSINQCPAIDDTMALVQDCQTLIKGNNTGAISIDRSKGRFSGGLSNVEWPQTLSALKPRAIFLKDDRVVILISTGGIGSSFGYMVPYLSVTNFSHVGRRRVRNGGVYLSKTKYENVYRWDGIE
jgi:hypothetical protein